MELILQKESLALLNLAIQLPSSVWLRKPGNRSHWLATGRQTTHTNKNHWQFQFQSHWLHHLSLAIHLPPHLPIAKRYTSNSHQLAILLVFRNRHKSFKCCLITSLENKWRGKEKQQLSTRLREKSLP